MKHKLILIFALFATVGLFAQTKVALHHSGTVSFYDGISGFTAAYSNAANGDTIYLPGGFFNPQGTIDKSLTIYGAGHYPDSTLATEKSIFTGGFYIGENADNLYLEGFQVSGDITFSTNASVNNVRIIRCRFSTINYDGDYSNPCVNNFILNNVIDGSVYGSNAQSLLLSNNIIAGKLFNMNTNVIQNNILMADYYNGWPYYSTQSMINFNNSTIKNNVIFCTDPNAISGTGNFVKNNAFNSNWITGSNVATGNYLSVGLSTFFTNQTGNSFNYSHNYHLQNAASYLGDDATEISIYGGSWGYKEGAVPSNPHIISKSISQQTNSNGEININIKVKAQ